MCVCVTFNIHYTIDLQFREQKWREIGRSKKINKLKPHVSLWARNSSVFLHVSRIKRVLDCVCKSQKLIFSKFWFVIWVCSIWMWMIILIAHALDACVYVYYMQHVRVWMWSYHFGKHRADLTIVMADELSSCSLPFFVLQF